MLNKLVELFKNKWEQQNGNKMPIEGYWIIRNEYNSRANLVDMMGNIKKELRIN